MRQAARNRDVSCFDHDHGAFILTANSSSLRTDDFDARGEDELTLRRGDKIELIELDDGFGDGWYLGRHITSGLTGLFPGGKSASPLAPPG